MLASVAAMMGKHVENWPNPKRMKTAIALIDKTLAASVAIQTDLLGALEAAPIIGAGETLAEFRARQDAWLNGTYRAAIANAQDDQA